MVIISEHTFFGFIFYSYPPGALISCMRLCLIVPQLPRSLCLFFSMLSPSCFQSIRITKFLPVIKHIDSSVSSAYCEPIMGFSFHVYLSIIAL